MRYIDRSNDDNNKNKQIQSKSWIWLIAYLAIGLAISFVVASQFSDVRLLLSCATLLAYDWQIKPEWIHGNVNPQTAIVQVTLPDGRKLTAHTETIDRQ